MIHIHPAQRRRLGVYHVMLALMLSGLIGCGGNRPASNENTLEPNAAGILALPDVAARTHEGERLQVLATTSIIGDVVHQVGGDVIDLTVLMRPGQDPHSYQPGAADLAAAADANVIFVNGWNLEEALVKDLITIGYQAIIVPISAGIEPRKMTGSAEVDDHGPFDPHVWQDVGNVMVWVDNVRQVLSAADPANEATYAANAERYRAELQQLDGELRARFDAIPSERRVLITNHESLGYLADAYGLRIAGTLIPSVSTLAEPTAAALANLISTMKAENICTIFLETTARDQLARTLEKELTGCEEVRLIPLYTGSLGPVGSDADTYIGMMRANEAALEEGLQ